jgi:hypothetical protein
MKLLLLLIHLFLSQGKNLPLRWILLLLHHTLCNTSQRRGGHKNRPTDSSIITSSLNRCEQAGKKLTRVQRIESGHPEHLNFVNNIPRNLTMLHVTLTFQTTLSPPPSSLLLFPFCTAMCLFWRVYSRNKRQAHCIFHAIHDRTKCRPKGTHFVHYYNGDWTSAPVSNNCEIDERTKYVPQDELSGAVSYSQLNRGGGKVK